MIGVVLVGGILIGLIAGWAVAAWRNASTIAPPLEQQFHWTAVGLERADPQATDALWQQQLFKQLASRRISKSSIEP
jgi:hypothetical protein